MDPLFPICKAKYARCRHCVLIQCEVDLHRRNETTLEHTFQDPEH